MSRARFAGANNPVITPQRDVDATARLIGAIRTGRVEPFWHPALRDTLEFARSLLERRTRTYDAAEHRILTVLVYGGDGLPQQAMADRIALGRSLTSEAARRLEERQQLRRSPQARDNRKLLLLASPETASAAARSAKIARAAEREALRRLSDEERECLQRLLTKAL